MVIILLLVGCGVTFCVYRNLDINVEKYDVAIIDSVVKTRIKKISYIRLVENNVKCEEKMHGDYVSDIFNASLHSEIKKRKVLYIEAFSKTESKIDNLKKAINIAKKSRVTCFFNDHNDDHNDDWHADDKFSH